MNPLLPPEEDKVQSARLLDLITWMAQTIHQGHHHDVATTWKECPRGFCMSVVHGLRTAGIKVQ